MKQNQSNELDARNKSSLDRLVRDFTREIIRENWGEDGPMQRAAKIVGWEKVNEIHDAGLVIVPHLWFLKLYNKSHPGCEVSIKPE